jgi:hypothetical protein
MAKDSLRIFRNTYGDDSVHVGHVLNSLGTICIAQGKYKQGAENFEECLRVFFGRDLLFIQL